MTILLLFDRLNWSQFKPKYYKPSTIISKSFEEEKEVENFDVNSKLSEISNPSSNSILPPIEKFLKSNEIKNKKEKKYENFSNLIDVNQILDRFDEENNNEFGSFKYRIRSRPYHDLTSSSAGNIDSFDIFANSNTKQTKNIKANGYKNREKLNVLDQSLKQEFSIQSKEIRSFEKLDSNSCNFEYNKVTKDIYKNFGLIKNLNAYPQNLSQLNKIKNKPWNKNRIPKIDEINGASQDEEFNSLSNITNMKPFDNMYRNKKKSIYYNRFVLSKSEGSIENISRTENKTPLKILKAQ
jgi:hypothetical protein